MNRTVFIGLILIVSGGASVLGENPTTTTAPSNKIQINALIGVARSHTEKGQYREALATIDQILALDPANDYARGVRPLVADRADNHQPATQRGEITSQPVSAQALLDKALPEAKIEDAGIGDLIDFLRDLTGANIFVNWRELEKAGIGKETPVSIGFKNTTGAKVLSESLLQAGKGKLGYKVDGDLVIISTQDDLRAATQPSTKPVDRSAR